MPHAAKFGDLVFGIDLHRVIVPGAPQPVPLPHPFIGVVYDPLGAAISAAVSKLAGGGGLVLVQGSPAATVAMDVVGRPHLVLPPGVSFAPDDIPDNKGMIVTGSKTVTMGGLSAARFGSLVSSCGWPVNLPTSVCLAAPLGGPVEIGGPESFEVLAAVTRGIRTSWFSGKAHQLFKVKPGTRLSKTICFLTGHPVNVMTGEVLTEAADFSLPGPIELVFERNYASRCATVGPLGPGWSHPLDGWVDERGDKVVVRLPDGREREHDALRPGEAVWDDLDRYELARTQAGYTRTTWDGMTYAFGAVAGATVTHPLVKIEDRCGNAIECRYADGALAQVIDSAGRALRLAHERGRLARVLVRRRREDRWLELARYEYENGLLAAAFDAEGHALRYAYRGGVLVKETNRNGLSFHFEYDEEGPDGWCVRTWGDGGIYARRMTYDKHRSFTVVEDSRGGKTLYHGNDVGLVEREVDPTGRERRYEWDEHCRKIAEIDGLGARTEWAYDERGNCVLERDAIGNETRRRFDELNVAVEVADAAGAVWRRRHDGRGCVREVIDPLGNVTRFEHDRRGLVTAIVDALGRRSTMRHDERGELVEATDTEGARTAFESDDLGRPVRQVDARGGETRLAWDRCGRLVAVRRPDGAEARYAHDAEGNVVEHVDGLGHRWRFRYAGLNQLVERIDPMGGAVRYALDTEENLVGVINEVGETYRIELDLAGRVVSDVGFDGRRQEYRYDAAGRCCAWVDGAGRRTQVERDAPGRIVKLTVPAAPAPGKVLPGVQEIAYRWDATGILVSARNAEGEVVLERDASGRVVRERFGGVEVVREMDAAGERVARRTSLGHEARYEVDGRGARSAVSIGARWSAATKRDALGAEVERRLPGGVVSRWERDAAGRPVVHRVVHEGKQQLAAVGLRWRAEQQLAAIVDTQRGATAFVHDARGALIGSQGPDGQVRPRVVDEVGNVFRSADRRDRAYGSGGRLLLVGGTELRHGDNGEVVEKVLPDGRRWRYRWDGRGQLVEVTRPDGTRAEYGYDALGRRVRKQVGGRTTAYVWDGDELVHEVTEGAPIVTWEMDPETLGPLAKVEGERAWGVLADAIGAPRLLVDEPGEVGWRGELDLFGEATVERAATACPWRWPGQYEDEETGLFYNRFRYYDPELGRYLSQDPIGLEGGTGLYAYVLDPLSWIDPLGLNCGKQGERIARAWLKRRGFSVLGGVRNRSNHGIDLVARDASGRLWFFEVKTTTGLVAPALSREQAMGALHYVPSRLRRAARGWGAWRALHDPKTSAMASALLQEIRRPGGGFSAELIQITLGNGGIKSAPW